MREVRPWLWHWQAPHPEWRSDHSWPEVASSYALDDGVRLLRAVVLVLVGMLVLVGVLFLGACGGDEKDAADTSAASATAPPGEPIVIRSSLIIPAEGRLDDRQRHRRIRRARRKREKRGRVWPKPQFAGSLHVYRNRHAIGTR